MDHKSWLWRKKSSEKTIVVSDKVNLSVIGNGEETLAMENTVRLESSMENLNQKLSSALMESNTKDVPTIKHMKVAEKALAGWDKAEAEALPLKQELAEALRQRVVAEERIAHLDAALKECMQQLRFVREDQEQRIHDAVIKASREREKAQMVLEEKLAETSKRLAKVDVENTHLRKTLQAKENLIEDLSECNSQAEADLNALIARLDSTEKYNASLKYELRMLEKELEIRNEEREFNSRSADVSHKQHLESVKKIAKLETECHRLRLLVRKRLPGPAALAKMKNEVEMLEREPDEMWRRTKLNPQIDGLNVKDFVKDNSLDTPNKRINYLIERLCAMEEENKTLKEALSHKSNGLQSPQIMCARKASKLSKVEAQLGDLSHGFILASISEDDVNEDAESRSASLISEMDHFRNVKPRGSPLSKTVGGLDISLMDDFVEMEKIAIVSMDKSIGSPHVSSDGSTTFLGPMETELGMYHSSLNESISKIIELLEGINQPSLMDYGSQEILSGYNGSSVAYKNLTTSTGYIVRVFQWKSSELNAVIEKFIHTCNDLLNGKADLGIFARELTSALDWTVNHCFSIQDVSSMKDTIKKHCDWDESQSESELGVGVRMNSLFSEAEKENSLGEQSSFLPSYSNSQIYLSQMEEIQSNLKEENKGLKDDLEKMESAKRDMEGKLQLATNKIEVLMIQLQESEKSIVDLQKELEALKETKGVIEGQIENHKLLNKDLNTQLTVAKVELNESRLKISSMEAELDDKSKTCRELETTCLELRLQLESVTSKEIPRHGTDHEERQLQTGWEITAASEKLAECQETILNLGKQLKALASPREAGLLDKVISITPATTTKNSSRRSSLLDQMLAEDNAETNDLKSPKMKEIICTSHPQKLPSYPLDNPNAARGEPVKPLTHFGGSNETKHKTDNAAGGALANVPRKNRGGLLRKLLMRKKKDSNNKMSLLMVA